MNKWNNVKISDFLYKREGVYKPNHQKVKNLKRLQKIDFAGNIHIVDKKSKTNMIIIKQGDLVISGINVSKGALAVYEGKEDITATIHYSSYTFNKNKISIDFLKNFLKSSKFIQLLKNQVKGGIKTEIKPKHILPLEIKLPDKLEQEKIVHILNNLEKNITELNNEVIGQQSLIKQLRQAILQEAVEGKLTVDWRKKHTELISGENSAENLLKKIKIEKEQLIKEKKIKKQKSLLPISEEEKSFKIPEGWIWIRVGEVIEIIMGQSPPGYSYNKKGVGLPFFQGKKEFGIIYPKGNSVWCHKPKRISRKNDILISVRAPVGDINLSDKEYSIGRGLSIIRNFSKNLLTWYTYFFLDAIKNQWDVKGSFFSAITKEIIINRIFPLPSIFEQQVIVNRISNFMNIVDELEKQVIERKEQTTQLIHSVLRETFEQK